MKGFQSATPAVQAHVIITVRAAIKLYLASGMLANRAYTPQRMREFASMVTGKSYKRSKVALIEAWRDLGQELENRYQTQVLPL